MKLTNEVLYDSLAVLARVSETGKLGYACAKNRRKIADEIKEYMDKRDELLDKYGKQNANGSYNLTDKNLQKYLDELAPYSEMECDVNLMTVEPDEFYGGNLNSQDMFILDWMIAE